MTFASDASASASQDYHFSFSLAVLGESRVGKSKLITCTLPEAPAAEEEAEPGVDHGVKCKAHTYESRGARYQILMWEVPGAPRYLDTAPRYASMAAGLCAARRSAELAAARIHLARALLSPAC